MRSAKLPRLGTQAAHTAKIASVRGELLHEMVRRGDPDLIPGVDDNADVTRQSARPRINADLSKIFLPDRSSFIASFPLVSFP